MLENLLFCISFYLKNTPVFRILKQVTTDHANLNKNSCFFLSRFFFSSKCSYNAGRCWMWTVVHWEGKAKHGIFIAFKNESNFFLLFQATNTELISDCECILVVFSVANLASLREAKMILKSLYLSGELNSKSVILVGNKTDLVRAREVLIDGNINSPMQTQIIHCCRCTLTGHFSQL